jgi:hypothetical protein
MTSRRQFFEILAAAGLSAKAASAIGIPKNQVKRPEIAPKLFQKPHILAPVWDFECVIGDCLGNANGHRYTEEVWHKMFAGFPDHGPYVTLEDGFEPALRLDLIAGRITEWRLMHHSSIVLVKMHVMKTPEGQIVQQLAQEAPLFITPVGAGTIQDGTINADDYQFSRFRISNNSAFDVATPLRPVINQEKVLIA